MSLPANDGQAIGSLNGLDCRWKLYIDAQIELSDRAGRTKELVWEVLVGIDRMRLRWGVILIVNPYGNVTLRRFSEQIIPRGKVVSHVYHYVRASLCHNAVS